MKSTMFIFVGLVIAAGVLAASVIVPTSQTPRIQAGTEIIEHIELARRLLHRFDTNLSIESQYRELLGEEAFALSAESLDELMQDPDFDIIEEANAALKAYEALPAIRRLSETEESTLKLQYGASNWQSHQRPRPPSRMQGARMASKGDSDYERKLSENAKLLKQALAEVQKALAVNVGDYNARQHSVANRLKGIIHYQQGLVETLQIALLRSHLGMERTALTNLATALAAVVHDKDLVELSAIDDRIADANDQSRDQQDANDQQHNLVGTIESKVKDLELQLSQATARSAAAREAMETLQDFGIDLSSPSGFEQFRSRYEEQATKYRQAVAAAHAIEFGSLSNATIDFTGDYIHGEYEPTSPGEEIGFEKGLLHYRQDLDSAIAKLDKMIITLSLMRENVEALEQHKRNFGDRAQIALDAADNFRDQIVQLYPEFKSLDERVRQVEDEALARFDEARKAFKNAENGLRAEIQAARDAKPTNPALAESHYSSAAADDVDWLSGQLIAQQADADLRKAVVLVGSFQDARASMTNLSGLSEAVDVSADLSAWQESAGASKEEATELLQTAIQNLQNKAKRKIGGGNWTVAAQIGAAYYLLANLDEELAAEKALEWYDSALQGRDDDPLAQNHVSMRDYIESRENLGGD